ncbi:hypothetical protein KFV02_10100 [Desulfohalobiaceae bacterium Ax17]|uniref:FliH/SctL family protein n=1 Tax=Desulfovulcanus ferrireducens TaxID=2831190 RepID=UPI00207BCF41|nr:FliH/SctL family protein [Desulfovulcanus ferrireducens]MBT8764284.1 hypothetical protein [Desulfovulcanus ferrireducens]
MSKSFSKPDSGKVIVGLQTRFLAELEARATDRSYLTPETEDKFWERVKARAQEKAREIIARAMQEAQGIREQAREEGLKQGQAQAAREIEKVKQKLTDDFARVISQIEQEKCNIWQRFRQDLVLLTRAAVEKVLGLELEKNKEKVLENLLDQALELIESKEELVIRVNPDDTELLQGIMDKLRAKHPQLSLWQVKPDPQITQGGLVLENGKGMVDNTIEGRYAAVKKILDELSLDEDS